MICNPHNNVFLNSVGLDCKSSPTRATRGYRTSATTGKTYYTYDNAGNLVEESNPLGGIFYDYTYYRL